MIYDIVNIVNLFLCVLGGYNYVVVISRVRTKSFVPPIAKRKYSRAMWALLGVASFAAGLILRCWLAKLFQEPISAVFGVVCCILISLSSYMFLYLAKEEEIIIRDGLSNAIS